MCALACFHGGESKGDAMDSRAWRRGFLGGFAALALAVSGQVATSSLSEPERCPRAQPDTPVAQAILEQVVAPHGLTQRVALAVLTAMLAHTCS
jgi:hypothetical protein